MPDVRPLTPATWPAYADLIRRHDGVWGGCWCLAFHPAADDPGRTGREAAKRSLVEAGRAEAALVFDGDACLGWAQYGPPRDLPRIKNRRAYETGQDDAPPPDWRITCFFTDRARRRDGIAALALRGAVDLIAKAGGGTVEGYPEEIAGQRTSAGFLWCGTLSLFEREGFDRDRKIGKHRWVVRRTV